MKTNLIRRAANKSACALICAGSILAFAAYAQVELNTNIDFNIGAGIYTYSHAVLNQGPTFDLAIVNLTVATNSNLMNLSAPTGFDINFDPGVGVISFFEDAGPATPQTFAPTSTTTPFTYTSTFAPVPIGFDALDAGGNTFTGFTLSAAPDSSAVNNAVVTGIISGNFTLTKTTAGMLTLTNTNTYTGGTTLNAGTLSFANGSLGSVGTVEFAGNATLQYFGNNTQDISSRVKIGDGVTANFDTNGNNVTFASAFQLGAAKTGALTKIGAGALILTGANTYTGGTTLNAGVLAAGNGSAFGRGNLTVNAGTLQTSGGPLVVNIGGGKRPFQRGHLRRECRRRRAGRAARSAYDHGQRKHQWRHARTGAAKQLSPGAGRQSRAGFRDGRRRGRQCEWDSGAGIERHRSFRVQQQCAPRAGGESFPHHRRA